MSMMNDLRPDTVASAKGDVLEIGFGTGLNLHHYGPDVRSVTGVDPMDTSGVEAVEARIRRATMAVERNTLGADGTLPFDTQSFDSIVTTWTLCSIPDVTAALSEMRRVLKPGGEYVFIEHGRSARDSTAHWQDRLNPLWRRLADGCNMNRPIDELVKQGGFELVTVERFRAQGPAVLASMYRGTARPR